MNRWMETIHDQVAPFLLNHAWPMVWQSSLLIVLVAAANRTIFRRASAQLRYVLWGLVLVRLLIPPSLDLPTSIRHWGTPGVERYASSLAAKVTLTPSLPTSLENPSARAVASDNLLAADFADTPPEAVPVALPPHASWATVVAVLWAAGVTMLASVLLIHLVRYRRLLRRSTPPPAWIGDAIAEYKSRMKVQWRVDARVVEDNLSPSLMGLCRLTILLPARAMDTLSEHQLRAVLVHELAHVKRWDFLVNWAQVLLGIAYFFHPLFWFANRQMRIEREHACDDLALVTLGLDRKAYAESLVRVAETVSAPYRLVPVQIGVAETRMHLARRLRRILDHGLRPAPRLTVLPACIVIAFAAVFGTWHYSQTLPAEATATAETAEELLSLTVKVVDESGAPVEGAELKVAALRAVIERGSSYGWLNPSGAAEAPLTDAHGIGIVRYPRYIQERMETGEVAVAATHPEFVPSQPVDLKVDGSSPAIVLQKGATLRVSGYIQDEGSRVAPVHPLLGSRAIPSNSGWTQLDDGILERANVQPGATYLWLTHRTNDGAFYFSESIRQEVLKGETSSLHFPLHRGVSLAGRLDDSVPRPVKNGWVEVHVCPQRQFDDKEQALGLIEWTASTEIREDGSFEFDGLPLGHAELVAACDGAVSKGPDSEHNGAMGRPIVTTLDGDLEGVAIAMEATSTAIVTVQDSGGNPIAGAKVVLWPNVMMFDYYSTVFGRRTTDTWQGLVTPPKDLEALWATQRHPYQAISDEHGIATIPNLPAWEDSFAVEHENYNLPIRDTGMPGGRREQIIALRPGETTHGVAMLEPKGATHWGDSPAEAAAPQTDAPVIAGPSESADPFAIPVTPPSPVSRFQGYVVDDAGEALEGVSVKVSARCSGNSTHTREDGSFIFDLEPDRHHIEARFSKPGWSPVFMSNQPVGALTRPVVMTTKTYFAGTVTGVDGTPVAGAIIRAGAGPWQVERQHQLDTISKTESSADGSYRLPVQHDTYTVVVTSNDQSAVLPNVAIAQYEAKKLDIKLSPSPVFRARVLDSLTKEPVAGVQLINSSYVEIRGTSDDQGKISITGLPEGPIEFAVRGEKRGLARWWSENAIKAWERQSIEADGRNWQRNFDTLSFQMAAGSPEVTIVVEHGAHVRGKVVDPGGNPVASATVAPALTGSGNSITGDTRFSVRTDEHGMFDMLLPAGKIREYNLIAHDGDYEEWRQWANGVMEPITTQPGDVIEDVVVQLQPPCTVRGVALLADGTPAASREVRATSVEKTDNRYYVPTTRADEGGNFELRFVAPGNHFVQVAPFWLDPEEAPEGTSQIVEVLPDAAVEGISLIVRE